MIKIDIWTDFVCEYCYIGKKELQRAIEKLNLDTQIEMHYKAFELMPDAPVEREQKMVEAMTQIIGKPLEVIQEMLKGPIERAESLGITIRYDDLFAQNTNKAHRVAKYAAELGKANEYTEALFYSIFTENKFLADTDTLVEVTEKLGLESNKVREIADDENRYKVEVMQDMELARMYRVTGVPFYVFNDKYAVSGAQPMEVFVQVLEKLQDELGLKPKLQVIGQEGTICGPNGCDI
jgi:predicted DsbA family dithiol-disulfide isomerase